MSDDQILAGVIATAMRGDDKYKRWPLPEMVAAQDRIEDLEAKLAKVTAAYRIEAMRRDDYSHEAFDLHLAKITGQNDE